MPNLSLAATVSLAMGCISWTLSSTLAHSWPLPEGWRVTDQQLECTYEFEDFVESVAFVEQLVDPAEALGHHPDIAIAFNRVSIVLTTHDAGGLTNLDFKLAADIDAIAQTQFSQNSLQSTPKPRRCLGITELSQP